MATLYNVNSNIDGVNGYGTPFSVNSYQAVLQSTFGYEFVVPGLAAIGMAPATEKEDTILIIFNYFPANVRIYVAVGSVPNVPAPGGFTLGRGVLRPQSKIVVTGNVLGFRVASGSVSVNMQLYSTQAN